MAVPNISITATLRVTGLPPEITGEVLLQHFGQYGAVTNPVIIKHLEQRELPSALLRFQDPARAEQALREEKHVIFGQEVKVERVGRQWPPQSPPNPKKIFVGGLPPTVTESRLYDFFKRFGDITECFIPTDRRTREPRRFGFVVFQSEEPVNNTLDGNESRFYVLDGTQVEVKKAVPKLSF